MCKEQIEWAKKNNLKITEYKFYDRVCDYIETYIGEFCLCLYGNGTSGVYYNGSTSDQKPMKSIGKAIKDLKTIKKLTEEWGKLK